MVAQAWYFDPTTGEYRDKLTGALLGGAGELGGEYPTTLVADPLKAVSVEDVPAPMLKQLAEHAELSMPAEAQEQILMAGFPLAAIAGLGLGALSAQGGFWGLLGGAAGLALGLTNGFEGTDDGRYQQMSNGSVTTLPTGAAYTVNGKYPIPIGENPLGLGVPEPMPGTYTKSWKLKAFSKDAGEFWVYYWRMLDGRTICYNPRTRGWKVWRQSKNIVLSTRKPNWRSMSKAARLIAREATRFEKSKKKLARVFK